MYLNEFFTETQSAEINALIDTYPLATLVLCAAGDVVINAIPLLRHGDNFIGHVALANDVHRFTPETAVAVFHGAHHYISPQWYPSKAAHHRHVPTWNYQMVQVFGTITFDHSEAVKRRYVHLLTQRFENSLEDHAPWEMGDAPADFMEDMLTKIVALTLHPQKVLAKSKLSQNRDAPDARNVAQTLHERQQTALAEAMDRSFKKDA